ncbi:MAG: hypothetical protein JNK15_21755 [Planctomycetes bacterium]|nr:hypothetical protein [Planctomycetota bacterium]
MQLHPALVLGLVASTLLAQDERRHGDGPHRGLPRDPAAHAPYSSDADHPANRVFRLLWLRHMAPAEVAATVDTEPMQWTEGWVHRKRTGTPDDAHWFGGDGRLLPLEGLGDAEAAALKPLLAKLRGDAKVASPSLQILLQHDLLRAAERLQDVERNLDLVPELLATAQALALPAAELDRIGNPLAETIAVDNELRAALPKALGGTDPDLREVVRKSTRLFDAEKTLLWSRVFLAHPDGEKALAALLPAARPGQKTGPDVPIGMRAVLVQGIVAMDATGAPRATPLVLEVRTQRLANRDGLAADNATWTHDGIDFAIWQLERQGARSGAAQQFYRRIVADDHDLFRDYGTAKYTTYRGQCSLCHRLTDTPEPQLGGFPVLRPHVLAAFATTGEERLRLAEEQAAKLFAKLTAVRPPK